MVGLCWTFVVTLLIMFVIDHIPGLHFRSTDEAEIVGMDEVEHGEYANDYVALRRDMESSFSPRDHHERPGSALQRTRSVQQQRELDEEEKGSRDRGRGYYSKERTIVEVASGSDEERERGVDRGGLQVAGNGAAGQGREEALRLRSRSRGRGFGAGGGGLAKQPTEEIELESSPRHASPRARRTSDLQAPGPGLRED